MFFAFVGAITAQLALSGVHDRQIAALASSQPAAGHAPSAASAR
jgi:hypothetical protein